MQCHIMQKKIFAGYISNTSASTLSALLIFITGMLSFMNIPIHFYSKSKCYYIINLICLNSKVPYIAKNVFLLKDCQTKCIASYAREKCFGISSLIRFADLFCCCYFMVREPEAKLQGIFHNFYALP